MTSSAAVVMPLFASSLSRRQGLFLGGMSKCMIYIEIWGLDFGAQDLRIQGSCRGGPQTLKSNNIFSKLKL